MKWPELVLSSIPCVASNHFIALGEPRELSVEQRFSDADYSVD